MGWHVCRRSSLGKMIQGEGKSHTYLASGTLMAGLGWKEEVAWGE